MLGPWPIHSDVFAPKSTTWTPVWSQWLSRLVEEVNPGPGIPFAGLPVAPHLHVGETFVVNDAVTNAWGDVIAVGGGAFTVLVWWNGSAFRVIGQ